MLGERKPLPPIMMASMRPLFKDFFYPQHSFSFFFFRANRENETNFTTSMSGELHFFVSVLFFLRELVRYPISVCRLQCFAASPHLIFFRISCSNKLISSSLFFLPDIKKELEVFDENFKERSQWRKTIG